MLRIILVLAYVIKIFLNSFWWKIHWWMSN